MMVASGTANEKGRLIIVSGPSGAGKSTIIRRVLACRPELKYAISFTTRAPRGTERDGVDYYFVSDEEFREKINEGEFAEWAEVHGHFYGTSARFIEENLLNGSDVIVDVDPQGAKRLLSKYTDVLSIFVRPPTIDVLKDRLTARETDSPEVIERRLKNAREEMKEMHHYTYILVNDDLEKAVSRFQAILDESEGHG
jgi:guanylate kinase